MQASPIHVEGFNWSLRISETAGELDVDVKLVVKLVLNSEANGQWAQW
jgi:hypothetical protein